MPATAQQVISIHADGETLHLTQATNTSLRLRQLLVQYFERGFPFASLDTIRSNPDTLTLALYLGSKFDWRISEPWTLQSLRRRVEDLGNQGYPFASVRFDSLKTEGEAVLTAPKLIPGPMIVFDTLSLSGSEKISVNYLHVLLGFKPGDIYEERKYKEIAKRLAAQSLVELTEPPDIGFSNGKAIVYLKTKELNTDRAEGIFGFLPKAGGGSTVTGYLKLDLNNLFQSAKSLQLDWNRFSPESQSLDLQYGHPFLLGSRMSVGLDLSILRQDSLFTKRNFGLALKVPVSSNVQLGLRLQSAASDIQANEPDVTNGLDYRLIEYKPFVSVGTVSDIVTYRNSFGASLSVGLADKKFRRNTLFPEVIYDTLEFRTTNVQVDLVTQFQKTFMKRGAIFSKVAMGFLEGDQIVTNEFYRIGGLKSLRGFDENVFFASSYIKWQMEYRQYFGPTSYLLAFFDIALLDQVNSRFSETTLLNAFGGGMSLDTGNGNFSLIFALGSGEESPLDVRNTKIHFGYSISF